jgi:putative transposase
VANRRVIDHLVDQGIRTLVIGYNPNWKQQVTNQEFVSVPHHKRVEMLTYKAQLAGIQVRAQDGKYCSKCSFLDGALPQKQAQYAGHWNTRGLFRAVDNTSINADVNVVYKHRS